MSEKIIIKKTTVVPSTVKVSGKKDERVISTGKWIVGIFTDAGKFLTGAQYMDATKDVDGKYGRDWAKKEYAQHYAHELATREKAAMTAAVIEGLEEAEEKWEKAEKQREADAKYRKEHKDEVALKKLQKAAQGAAKACKSDAVEKFANGTAAKAGRLIDLLDADEIKGEGIVDVDAALQFLDSLKARASEKAA